MKNRRYGFLLVLLATPAIGQRVIDVEKVLEKAQAALQQTQQQTQQQVATGHPERRRLEADLEKVKTVLEQTQGQFQLGSRQELKTFQAALAQLGESTIKQDVELLAQAQTIAGQGQFEQARIQAEAARAMSSAVRDGVAFQLAKGLTTSYGGGSYDGGTRALDDKRYEDAIRQFDGVINGKSPRADGALYWKAYALDRAGRKDEALAALARLRADYPQSRWLNDAQALESTVKQGSGQPASAATEANQDLKLMAINSLMNADPERAVPLLEGILKGSGAPRVKDRALFVLTQSKAPRASQLLNDYAKGAGNPDMQNRAIRYLGMSGSPEAQQQLSGIYTASTDIPVKREIIRSLIMSRATEQIFNLAKTEKEPELRLEAIRQLGAMRASSQLLQLYASEATADNKINIVRSLMAAGAGDKLMELAKSEKDVKVRGEVVRSMAMTRGTPIEAILQFYSAETDAKIRRDLINGLSNRGEVKTLVDLARKETDPALKKTIVERLSMSKAKEATDYMMELLK